MIVRMLRSVVILVVRVIAEIGQRNRCFCWEPLKKITSLDIEV